MATSQREERAARHGECRRCRSFCDKLIEPRGCIEIGCRFLYSYIDMLNGRHYVGCMQQVFAAEIDIEALMTRDGFGGIKATGDPLPQCQFTVERAFEGSGPDYECVNPRFFDCSDRGPEGLRAFDLRNHLRAA